MSENTMRVWTVEVTRGRPMWAWQDDYKTWIDAGSTTFSIRANAHRKAYEIAATILNVGVDGRFPPNLHSYIVRKVSK